MAVLTISRDIGSGGLELARRVSELIGYRLADKNVIEHLMREYGFMEFERSYESSSGFWGAEEELTERTLSFMDRVVRALAKADNTIIVGRGSFAPLTGLSDVVHVRATAPFSVRVERVMREHGIAIRADAEERVAKRDKARRGFVTRYYGTRWEDASPFDLVINIDTFGIGKIAELLADTLQGIDELPRTSPSVNDLTVDSLLLEAARKRLNETGSDSSDD